MSALGYWQDIAGLMSFGVRPDSDIKGVRDGPLRAPGAQRPQSLISSLIAARSGSGPPSRCRAFLWPDGQINGIMITPALVVGGLLGA